MSTLNDLTELSRALDGQPAALSRLQQHWRGEAPASFLSKKSRDALDGRLSRLSLNVPRLVVNSKVDRLNITGILANDGTPARELWADWLRAGMVTESELVHADYYLYGRAYVLVWSGPDGRPRPIAGNPFTMYADEDPMTGRPTRAIRRWKANGKTHALIFTPGEVTRYQSNAPDFAAAPGGWGVAERYDNPYGVVPVVPFVRRLSADDHDGTSAVVDILDLTEALTKVLGDALVTSEHYARPRRWATGLEIEEDDDGNVIDPFGDSRFLQSEDPATKFGQFDSVRLDGYTDLTATITQQIGSLTGLPPHYLGLHGDQAANADGVRAAEAQLASAAYSDQRHLDRPWAAVAQLMAATEDPARIDAGGSDYRPSWDSPEIRTPGQAADAAQKQRAMGIPLETILRGTLGYSPDAAERIAAEANREQITAAAGALRKFAP